MKILYASFRYNPKNPDAGSGVDFNIYHGLKKLGVDLHIVGPINLYTSKFERLYRLLHRFFSNKNTAKFSEAYLHKCARELDKVAKEIKPDAIFTHNLIPLVYAKTKLPIIYKSDAILKNMHPEWPTYSKIELNRMLNWERRAIRKSSLVITASRWAEKPLLEYYKVPKSKIVILPIPSSLPENVIPEKVSTKQLKTNDIHLITVAKNFHLKGVDIAVRTLELLREKGINAVLRIIGQNGKDTQYIQYRGLYKKIDPIQLHKYAEEYKWADFLIHPARYEAAGIVCSEAAAFGVPTITNNVGGLATTVKDGISGVVLPKGSLAEKYAETIQHYVLNPKFYSALSRSTRERYENELNWSYGSALIYSEICKIINYEEQFIN